jgi:SNF2 family DNA or RNA helicase
MGLGKTMSTLAFISEWNHAFSRETAQAAPAALVVAPLSLLENWKQEIESTFADPAAVFTRVFLAHGRQLAAVEKFPGSRDSVSDEDSAKDAICGLIIGTGTERSLDMPGSIVLTTYETLRNYRFSFGKAEWGCVILDEAQTIKNPAARITCVAKSLKARVRIALTGTPVENSLADLWSLMDFITPGKLKPFQEFRRTWMLPLLQPTLSVEEKGNMGQALLQEISDVFLRRMKTDILQGLPKKTVRLERFAMNETQAQHYAGLITNIKTERKNWGQNERQMRTIAALHRLRIITLHPALQDEQRDKWFATSSTTESRAFLCQSSKLKWLLTTLDEIKRAGEKALVFCITKDLQAMLKHHLSIIYGRPVPVINGDTKSRENSSTRKETRLGIISNFTKTEGFAVAVLSPIAAGVGLNIVAANHVIHLERHWNPAKEDQATDRVYRIGQQRPVHVYLPVATHPSMNSFDHVLDQLIARKRQLQSSLRLIPVPETTEQEVLDEILKD